MTSWAKRFGSWASGQVSPFAGPTRQEDDDNTITDSDFSYITEEDLQKHEREPQQQQQQHHHHQHAHHHSTHDRPPRDTDVLVVRHRNTQQQVHFPAYSISDGQLTVGGARDQIARRLEVGDPRKIRMFWKGHNLKDNSATLRDEGMRSDDHAEILCVIGDQPLDAKGQVDDSGGSDDELDGDGGDSSGAGDGQARAGAGKKKKRNRRGKKSRKGGASTPTSPGYVVPGAGAEHLPIPSGTHPLHRGPSNTQSPAGTSRGPSPQPQTPLAKLQAIEDKYRADLVPGAEAFMAHPPADPAKRQFEHKKHTETILAQVLLKLDGVEVEGDDDARAKRRALVKETQAFLNKLDAVVKQ